jgi:hypothetical protein
MRAHGRWMLLILALTLSFLALAGVPETPAQVIPNANHYKCYEILNPPVVNIPVTLVDQFDQPTNPEHGIAVRPHYLCNPVQKNNYSIVDPSLHYVCYDLNVPPIPLRKARVWDQFFPNGLDVQVQQARLLCLPASKVLLN